MRTNYLTSIVPGMVILGGVFLFGMGIAGGLTVYFTAKLVGLTNTMLPLVRKEIPPALGGGTHSLTISGIS